jgi:hypothetical protein
MSSNWRSVVREAIDAILDRWGHTVEPGKFTGDYLQEIVDALKDNVAPTQTGNEGKPKKHFLLPLLIWAEVSRRQIISRKIGVNSVIEFLANMPLPNGKAYGDKQLRRLYKDGAAFVEKLDPWVVRDVSGAIQAADRDETWVPRVDERVRNKVGRYKKQIEARYAEMSEEEQLAESERVFLNQLRQQITLDPPARERTIIDDCLLGIAKCRGIKLTEIDAKAWVKSVISEL